jgi:hypothetical protein
MPNDFQVDPMGEIPADDPTVKEAIPHLSDEPIELDRPILTQLKDNLGISVKPSKREVTITDGFKF